MSECDRPLATLLTAEVDELAGRSETEVSRHVRDCPRCGSAARSILAANDALDDALGGGKAINVETLIARAHANTEPARPRSRRPRWSVPRIGWLPLGAAAALGVLAATVIALLVPTNTTEQPLPGVEWFAQPEEPVVVDAPGYNVAVIATTNPDITIFWFIKETDDAPPTDSPYDGPIAIGPGNGL